jgi:hypothetical protein
VSHFITPFVGNVQERHICGDRKQRSGPWAWGSRRADGLQTRLWENLRYWKSSKTDTAMIAQLYNSLNIIDLCAYNE